MHRRQFIQTSLAAAATLRLASSPARAASSTPPAAGRRIDTNVSLFQWPARRLPLDRTAALLGKMEQLGITQAWAGSFEGILERDIAGVNARLAEECGNSGGRLLPFGSVNPSLPGWEDDVRRCHEEHQMKGIRVHPNYHGYGLSDPRFKRLLGLAAQRSLVVQVMCLMEDSRTQLPLLSVPDVDVAPLPGVLAQVPGARVLLLNSGKIVDGPLFGRLIKSPGIFFDIARVEYVGAVGRLVRQAPPGRVVFGSHAPFFIYESAVIKLFESDLTAAEQRAIVDESPRALLYG